MAFWGTWIHVCSDEGPNPLQNATVFFSKPSANTCMLQFTATQMIVMALDSVVLVTE